MAVPIFARASVVGLEGCLGPIVSFGLGYALLAFCFAMSCIEVFLEVGPGLVLGCCFKQVVAVIVVDAGFVDNGVRRINNLLVHEGSVARLGMGLDVLDKAVESLDCWLAGIPFFV
jgi:hypothetical protein